MKRKMFFLNGIFSLVLISIVFFGCKKDNNEKDSDTQLASDNALASKIYNDVQDIADEAGNTGSVNTFIILDEASLLSSCATVTRDTVTVPHRITIDFSTTNCLCKDGNYRRGKIYIDFTRKYRDSSATHTISFDNYFVNDNQVSGSKTVTNNGRNSQGHLTFTIVVSGKIILANNAGTITWAANRTREWIAGENTIIRNDDIYLISGIESGTRASGKSYSSIITKPLRMEVGCQYHHFVSGTIEITPLGKATRTLDYGSGVCDDVATVTINGISYNIKLH